VHHPRTLDVGYKGTIPPQETSILRAKNTTAYVRQLPSIQARDNGEISNNFDLNFAAVPVIFQ
jgi:hypothetical protein